MKKLFIFLLVVSVMLMLVFSSSYKKNPHLSKINDDVSIAKMKIKEKSYFDDSKVEEKIYGDEEEKLLDHILHIKYDDLPIYQIVVTISEQLNTSCEFIIVYNEEYKSGDVSFVWETKEKEVSFEIPITKRNKKYCVMELSELTSSTMNDIDEDEELTSEEKESLKAKTYREAWSPDLFIRFNGEGNFFTLEDIKSLDEIRDLVGFSNQNSDIIAEKNIFEFAEGNYEISEYASAEFLAEIMKANKSHSLPFVYTGELSIESLTDTIYSNLGADRAIIDGAAGNKIGAYLFREDDIYKKISSLSGGE
ncbi:MAG: head-tail adaptor protein, partial [Fusobacterium periodonticum]|nr:head-tail adaptor protein [Fusobacterium periodonticum]